MTADEPTRRLEQLRHRTLRELEYQLDHGRLQRDEFDQRATTARAARSAAELRPLIADLAQQGWTGAAPPAVPAARASAAVPAAAPSGAPELVLAVMSAALRDGEWDPPAVVNAVAFMGGVKLDFRDCRLAGDVRVHAYAVMGGVTILVPPDVQVSVRGFGLMGGFGRVRRTAPAPGAPQILIDGLALMGGVDVKVRERGEDDGADEPAGARER